MANENAERFTSPVGRLVGGDPYTADVVKDQKTGQTKLIQNGVNAGQPVTSCYTPLAIPKTQADWKNEPWAQKLVAYAKASWPNGQSGAPAFAWKITDGDSDVPNKKGNKPRDREGYPGHWVLQLSSFRPPQIVNENGQRALPREEVDIKPGDWVQMFIEARSNGSSDSPGLYLEAKVIAFQRTGDRIVLQEQIDTASLGFGQAPLPSAATAPPAGQLSSTPPPPGGQAPPPPRTEFSAQGAPPPPPSRLTDKARATGATTEADVLGWAGWSEGQLVAEGYLTP